MALRYGRINLILKWRFDRDDANGRALVMVVVFAGLMELNDALDHGFKVPEVIV